MDSSGKGLRLQVTEASLRTQSPERTGSCPLGGHTPRGLFHPQPSSFPSSHRG